jgi:hypothetical protein
MPSYAASVPQVQHLSENVAGKIIARPSYYHVPDVTRDDSGLTTPARPRLIQAPVLAARFPTAMHSVCGGKSPIPWDLCDWDTADSCMEGGMLASLLEN